MVEYYDEIAELEAQIKKTQYNKATQHHIGMVKAKIAKLREKAESRGKSSGPKTGFEVRKTGDGTVILLGFPSTGKSTLLNKLCGTESAVASYAFTTLTVIPGTLEYEHARIQILDVPGIVQGAASGRGRGKEVLATIRSADLCMLVIDAVRPHELDVVKREAASVGVRLNQRKPDVRIKKTAKGGVKVATTVQLTKIDAQTITDILKEFKITNADVLLREDIDVDQFIDCVEDNKKYMPAIVVCNKDDLITDHQRAEIARNYAPDIFVSAATGDGIDRLKRVIYDRLDLMSVYLKEPGKEPDMDVPLIAFRNSTIRMICEKLHKDFVAKFRFARVWGPSAKFNGQKLMLGHKLKDSDVLEIHVK